MPRKAIDYKKVIIYKLLCDDLSVKDLMLVILQTLLTEKEIIKIVA